MDLSGITGLSFFLAAIILTLTVGFLRFLRVLPALRSRSEGAKLDITKGHAVHLMVVLGSGGHTSEMLDMLCFLPVERYLYRTYIVQKGDPFSDFKVRQFERILQRFHREDFVGHSRYQILYVPRAREIHQSLSTTIFSAFKSFIKCLFVLRRSGQIDEIDAIKLRRLRRAFPNRRYFKLTTPDIILTNGPATGVMVVIAAFLLTFFGLQGEGAMKTIYVESWARVSSLSLSGKILKYSGLTDRFIVQWPGLASGRAEYRGPLVH